MKNLWLSAKLAPALILLGSFSSSVFAETGHDTHSDGHEAPRQHDAHNHGHSTLDLVQEGKNIQLLLESPAANIVGFEHEATNEQEKQKILKAVQLLRQGEKLFDFSASAQCKQTAVEVESELTRHSAHDDEHEAATHNDESHGDESHGDEPEGHSEFEVSYQFSCHSPAALDALKVNIFEVFPLTTEIDTQLVTDKRQFATELSPNNSTIHF